MIKYQVWMRPDAQNLMSLVIMNKNIFRVHADDVRLTQSPSYRRSLYNSIKLI